ncbi:hypothetical protein BDV06DRAFT_228461 [Aspergillus oleicola]
MAPKTWLIVGASRGIGLGFVRQTLARGDRAIATVRKAGRPLEIVVQAFIDRFAQTGQKKIDYVVVNAGILEYPNRATEMTFDHFAHHLLTNTVGPIIVAQKLLQLADVSVGTIAFMSSDSGSTQQFLSIEDGFPAYGASKAALNQALRHMTEELKRKKKDTIILALHPGEVATDMGKIEISWDLDGGQISAEESVSALIGVIESKTSEHTGTFWTWEGEVNFLNPPFRWCLDVGG